MKTQKQYWQKLQDPRWQRKRLEILNRAEFCCEGCGDSESQLQVHHGYYEKGKEPWEYEDDTLWCLCDKCHEKAHVARKTVNIALAKYIPSDLNSVADALSATEERDPVFYAQLAYLMRENPRMVERLVNHLFESIYVNKGLQQ